MNMKTKCLTEMEIAAYVDGLAEAEVRKRVESHLETCALCLHSVAELKRLADAHEANPVRTPEAALARAAGIISAGSETSPGFSIIAAVQKGLVKILETTGNLIPPPRQAPVPVRKRRDASLVPRVARSLSGFFVTVELSEGKDGITAGVTLADEASSEQPDGVKVKLRSSCNLDRMFFV
jgi:anti-sigma factor RsiW